MTQQPNYGQPNHGGPNQPPQPQYPQYPQQQQGYQAPPPQGQQAYPYPQQPAYSSAPPPQPYPPQQYGAPPPYPQVPPQQYAGQQPVGQPYQGGQYPGQPFPGQPFPGQPFPGQPPQGADQAQAQGQKGAKPKKKHGFWWFFFIILFSPFIAVIFVLYGLFWTLGWLLTPVALLLHLFFCALGLIWYSGVKVMASGRSKYRLFQPMYPKFPPLWTGQYWVRLNKNIRSTFEFLGGIAELLNW